MIVELAIKLDKSLEYYQKILEKANAVNEFNCITHDIYFTNVNLEKMTEEEMKNSCVRFRSVKEIGQDKWNESIQNLQIFDPKYKETLICDTEKIFYYQNLLQKKNWIQIFDTHKKDYQYSIGNMKSRIQLQEIDGIGLVLYYDNPNYYKYKKKKQRKKLIKELNKYGFSFSYKDKDLDKLRTLFFGKECYKEE